jgi:predicted permease
MVNWRLERVMFEIRWLRRLFLRLRTIFQRDRVERELAEEIQFHIDQRTELELAKGLTPEEARLEALRAMDGLELRKEQCRDARRTHYVDDLVRDLQYSWRNLRRYPGFAALAVSIMALGIGANAAVFSVVNAVLLKPLAFRNPDRIVRLSTVWTNRESPTSLSRQSSILNVQDWHDQSSSFDGMAYYASNETAVVQGSTAEYASYARVSPEFFRIFSTDPIIGRLFSPEEIKQGRNSEAVLISATYWQSHFGASPLALGQSVRVRGVPRTIIGVLEPGFQFPDKTDLWTLEDGPGTDVGRYRAAQNHLAIARLKPGVSVEQAQTEMTVISQRLAEQYPDSDKGRTVAVTPMRDDMVRDVRLTLYLLLGGVTVVLLIASANTATLLLGRAITRTREIAVRASLGASRPRIVRQLVTESLLLALIAGAAGLVLAAWGSKALVALAPADLPRVAEAGIDRWVLAFTLGVSVMTTVLFGLVPAVHASRVDLIDVLKLGATRVLSGGGLVRMRGILVVSEIALAVLLVSAAGLLIKSLITLQNVALGFRPENVVVMRATAPGSISESSQFFKDVLSRVGPLPGVLAAGATMMPPGSVDATGAYLIDQLPQRPDWDRAPAVVLSIVAPGTFAALGIPLTGGRDFNDGDVLNRPFVAVVNDALVRKSFAGQNPLGRTIFCPFDSPDPKGMTIVGVVGNVRQRGPAQEPMPECYMPYRQHLYNGYTLSVVVRTAGDPSGLVDTLRRVARETSPTVPVKFTTMEATVSANVAAPRFRTLLFTVFAGLAVCLAMAGVYGVISFAVGQRSNEIGLRIALGATTGSVLKLVLGQGVALAGLGLAVGMAGAAASTRFLSSMLFQVRPSDPSVYVGVASLLGAVALVASYVPARRASRIDPLKALTQE